ncbi:sodium-dependent bicarbonate transport family permease [Flammeovirga pacifica]|uniref:Sodium-dependent bicarbonate transport family permease n=1 Tax=Flammeovirga pacifica TaxID=915059 RepID=A0A1S1YT07_FLAPC|nr:sodium-dependent bicarbonate transport family permease [Flammeovirga pacifica]OHX64136.1 sodium-dependent bicarbonate transport family permease [Flammeovirga pacifica]
MNLDLFLNNITNPALLFFLLGIVAVQLKSDLVIPESSSKFISMYLLFAIGFKGGQELSHSPFSIDILTMVFLGIIIAVIIPIYSFFLIKKKLGIENAGAIASAYGSISAVTFITCVSFLELNNISFGGHMIAIMAMMEAPAIIVGVFLMSMYSKTRSNKINTLEVVKHSLTNGSVLLLVGSLIIGFIVNDDQAKGIAPFTTDLFKGFLVIFLLDMGISSGKKLSAFCKNGIFPFAFGVVVPLINGIAVAIISGLITDNVGDRLLISILSAGASYIAVPAAMKIAAPQANPGLYIPMALAVTFPFNITIGMPIYYQIIVGL